MNLKTIKLYQLKKINKMWFLFLVSSLCLNAGSAMQPLAANAKVENCVDDIQLFELSGKLNYYSTYHGGAAWNDEYLEPTVLANYTLKIVRLDEGDNTSKVVQAIFSDAKGNFSVDLPKGKYGFVGLEDKIVSGQYLPTAIERGDIAEYFTSSWTISTNGCVDLTKGAVNNIVLTRHDVTTCGICP